MRTFSEKTCFHSFNFSTPVQFRVFCLNFVYGGIYSFVFYGIGNWIGLPKQIGLKKIVEAERTLGLKIKPTKSEIVSLVTSLKTTIDNFSIFPKTLPRDQNTKER